MSDSNRNQLIRLRHTLLAIGAAVVLTLIVIYGYSAGYFIFGKDVLIASLIFLWWGNAGFFTAIVSGFNKRFEDPSLSLAQMIWGTSTSFFYFCSLNEIYLIIYLLVFLTMVFGALRLSIRQFRHYCWFTIAAALLSLYLKYYVLGHDQDNFDALVGTIVFMFIAFALTQVCVSLTRLRNHLKEKNLLLNDAISAKDRFLANISHEVRTPINGIIGMLEAIQRTSQTHTQEQYTRVAQSSANMLLAIVNDILDLSKLQAGKMAVEYLEFNLTEELDPLFDDFAFRAEQKNLTMLLEYDLDIPQFLRGDPVRIKQILSNLLSNAIKFTSLGEIRVSIQLQEKIEEQWVIAFSVADTGIGIEQDKADSLFDSFTQVDDSTTRLYGGTGLGLAICKQLCQIMGGDIELQSQYGQGSTFHFALPFPATFHELNADKPSSPKRNTDPKVDIFVVDQHASRSEHLVRTLNHLNFPTQHANSLPSFMSLVEQNTWQHRKPLIIINHDIDSQEDILNYKARCQQAGMIGKWIRLDSSFHLPDMPSLRSDGFDDKLMLPIKPYKLYDDIQILLKQSRPTTTEKNVAQEATRIDKQNGKLLLVEDNKINQQVALLTLHGLGYEVEVADNGQQAVDKLSDREHGFDLVLMDCQMPIMDGYQATKAIRQREQNEHLQPIPIVAMTANTAKNDVARCLACGMDAHIAKPFQQKTLADVLSHYIPHKKEHPIAQKDTSPKVGAANVVWDKEALKQRIGNDRAQLIKLLDMYLENARLNFEKLTHAIQQKDWSGASSIAHTLKGTAGNIHALHFKGTVTLLEFELASCQENRIQSHFRSVSEAWQMLKHALKEDLQRNEN